MSTTTPTELITHPDANEEFTVWRTGPDSWCGKWLRTFWQPIYRAADLPPGSSQPIRIMCEDLTIYRSQEGTPHTLGFRCGHRGAQLSVGWVEGENLRCFFHGWLYDPTGQCIEQPAERTPFCDRIKIKGYPTEEYLGLIFAYLGAGDPPTLPRYPDFEVGGVVDTKLRAGSYFDHLGIDTAHSTFVHGHRGRRKDWRTRGIPETKVVETEWGIMDAYEPGENYSSIGIHGMPNISQHIQPDPARPSDLRWVVPVDDDHNRDFSVDRVLTEEQHRYHERRGPLYSEGADTGAELTRRILVGELRIEDIEATESDRLITNIQDSVAQGGLGPVAQRSDHLGPADAGLIIRRKIYEREMRALAEGRPLTPWVRTERLYQPFIRDVERPYLEL